MLEGTLAPQGAAGGSDYAALKLRNTGSKACTLQGWPGVSFIDSAGRRIGAAADLDRSGTHETVTILPKSGATARLQIVDALNYPPAKCDKESTSRLRVYPPGSRTSLIVTTKSPYIACRDASVKLLLTTAFHASS